MPNFEQRVREVVERDDVPPLSTREHTANISEEEQLPPVRGGTRTLRSDTGYVLDGTVDISETIEWKTTAGIYGLNWPTDQINYTGTGNLFEGTNEEVMLRNVVIHAPTGQVFDVAATESERFLVQACAFVMCNDMGLVDGFKVPGMKLSDITNAGTGITHTGSPEKVYYTTTPFRELSGTTAISFDANFECDYIQVDNSFFREFNNDADAINFDNSATLNNFGIIKGCIFGPTVQNRTVGFDKTTPGWVFQANSGIQDSGIRGQYNLDSPTETTITSQAGSVSDGAAYAKIAGSTTPSSLIERVTHSNNEFTYSGKRTSTVQLDGSASADNVNDTVVFAFFKNGSLIDGSSMRSTLQGATTVNMGFYGEVELSTGDSVDARVANLTSTSNPRITDLQVKLRE